ncbi:ABC transporter substrate-binding protein [Virgibacillus dakarensis]|nr:ABC transporter substrate-binding protein [Virgibacillus dakarensis]
MTKGYKKTMYMVIAAAGLALVGCQHGEESSVQKEEAAPRLAESEAEPFLEFADDSGEEVVLEEKPERIVVLAPEMLKMVYDLDGEAVGRMTPSSIPVPEAAENVPALGTVSQINTEALSALDPDLVIGSPNFHGDLRGLMESSDIPFALLQMRSFEDVKEKANLLGKILGKEDKASQMIAKAEAEMAAIQKRLPKGEAPSVVVLNVTPKSVSVQRANTTAIEIGELLGVKNVGENMEANPDSQTSAPYSLETLAEAQPDYVLLTIHGPEAAGQKKIEEELKGNPAWASLNAVKEGNVHLIPSEKYLSNPGFDYADTMEHMAQIVYPEVFGNE